LATVDDVLLHAVEGFPERRSAVGRAVDLEDLRGRDRGRDIALGIAEPEDAGGLGEGDLLRGRQGNRRPGFGVFQSLLRFAQDGKRALDHFADHVTPMGHAHGGEFTLGYGHAVQTNEPEEAGAHGVAAGPVVRVDQHDLWEHVADRLGFAGFLVAVAKPEQVLVEPGAARVAAPGLSGLHHVEALAAQTDQDF
jgi:hypothetical protein